MRVPGRAPSALRDRRGDRRDPKADESVEVLRVVGVALVDKVRLAELAGEWQIVLGHPVEQARRRHLHLAVRTLVKGRGRGLGRRHPAQGLPCGEGACRYHPLSSVETNALADAQRTAAETRNAAAAKSLTPFMTVPPYRPVGRRILPRDRAPQRGLRTRRASRQGNHNTPVTVRSKVGRRCDKAGLRQRDPRR